MKRILSEKNVVIVLFVLVLITFSLAQEDSKKMERMYSGANSITAAALLPQILIIDKQSLPETAAAVIQ